MSNIIDKIQVSGVTYDIGGGGGSITIDPTLDSGSTNAVANSAITLAIDEKVNIADNIVSARTINYSYDVGDTNYKYPYNNGLIINEFYVKPVNQYAYTNTAAWSSIYITNGSSYTGIKVNVDCSNYQITAVTSTSGENFTYAIEDSVLHITLSEGYTVQSIQQNSNFVISFTKYTIESGQTADVINEDLIDVIQDIYDQTPKAYLTAATPNLSSTRLTIQNYKSDGSNSGQYISFGSSIKGDNNKMDAYLPSRYTTGVTLNTGTGNYCQVPSSTVDDYNTGFAYMDLAVNTGYTGSSTSFTFTVKTLFNNNTVQTDTFTYDVVNKTIGGNQLYIDVFYVNNTISIYPKQYRFSRIQSVSEPNCKIGGVDSPLYFKNQYIITGVTAASYAKQANIVINEIYSELNGKVYTSTYTAYTAATDTALAGKQTTLTAGTGIDITDNVISATGGGSVTVDTELDSGSTNPVENRVIYNKIDEVEEVTAAGLNALNDKITPTVELTQAQYDALVDKDPNTYYIITDAQAGDLTNYYTKSETNTLLGGKADTATTYTKTEVDTALSAKQATLVSGTNIKTINNTSILGSGNIDIQGGGKAIEAGRGIAITTGETADTVSFDLPIYKTVSGTAYSLVLNAYSEPSANTFKTKYNTYINCTSPYVDNNSGTKNLIMGEACSAMSYAADSFVGGYSSKIGDMRTFAFGGRSEALAAGAVAFGYDGQSFKPQVSKGYGSFACGGGTSANTQYSFATGYHTFTTRRSEFASGQYNNSVSATTTFGDSGNTLFSVGNGTADNARHNAFEIRQNGDIYLSSGGTDIKLQDHLGGGGSVTVDTALDSGSTNPVENRVIYNKIDEVEQVTAAALNNINDRLSEDEEVTAAALNELNDNFGGLKLVKLTQAEYNALATKDPSTLYVIVD